MTEYFLLEAESDKEKETIPSCLPLLIIGAGPYGLTMSAYARRYGIEHVVIGKMMDFWKSNMPKGMYLRSGCDWHYDPFNEDTIEHYLTTRDLRVADVEPLALDFYLDYVDWFVKQKGIEVLSNSVRQLNCFDDKEQVFEVVLESGSSLRARNVVLALGCRYFKNVPESCSAMFPEGRYNHTCDFVDFSSIKGRRVLILGGRQSAFEWAALLRENNADSVYVSYRHMTPNFERSDWSWVNSIVDGMVRFPGWFHSLTEKEREKISHRMWREGRMKLEPWLTDRIAGDTIKLIPRSQVNACKELPGGELQMTLNGTEVLVDRIILATGYKVNVEQIPFLAQGNLLARLETRNGFPVLGVDFQCNIPGLFFTSMCAVQDFGPFFGFTAAIRTSAHIIGSVLNR